MDLPYQALAELPSSLEFYEGQLLRACKGVLVALNYELSVRVGDK